jgi:hypothetical protein
MKNKYNKLLLGLLILFLACEKSDYDYSADISNDTGTAGSLARFAISENFLYSVDATTLKIFDITNEKAPLYVGETYVNTGVETIFCKDDFLFLGTQNGIYIYDITNPEYPQYVSIFTHIESCDPVVVNGNYAYSTLNATGVCSTGVNELDIINIANPQNPILEKTIQMDSPKGLGISSSLLFVCDEGLKVFDLTDPVNPEFLYKMQIEAFDVIPIDTLLLVATEQGLAEYSIDIDNQIHFISTLYSKK